jgi:flagellum-specific peptidoglycan hydrolase FlgJ
MITLTAATVTAAQAAMATWKIPASVTLAQYGQESGWGLHMPPGSFNPFGIKALEGEPTVLAPTREFIAGRWVTQLQPFAKFASFTEAFEAHAKLLATHDAYAPARAKLPDPLAFAQALTGVYATDPLYGAKLVEIIRSEGLERFDVVGAAAEPKKETAQ